MANIHLRVCFRSASLGCHGFLQTISFSLSASSGATKAGHPDPDPQDLAFILKTPAAGGNVQDLAGIILPGWRSWEGFLSRGNHPRERERERAGGEVDR